MTATQADRSGGNAGDAEPFFIVAAARSGTTLLRVMLDRHPDIAIPGEGHFIPRMWKNRKRYGVDGRVDQIDLFLADLARDRAFGYWELPIQAVRSEIGDRVGLPLPEAISSAYAAFAHAHGKERWADKTPDYIDHLALLARLFPKARFVHMIRDGRDVALSTIDLKRLHRHAATCGYFWSRQIGTARTVGRRLGSRRYFEVRYEDLIGSPEPILRRLCDFVGLAFDPALLDHDERTLEKIPQRFRTMHSRLSLPPTKGLRDWRTQMAPREVAEYESMAGPMLLATGYDLAMTTPTALTRARAWSRMGGFAARYAAQRTRRYLRGRTSGAAASPER